MGLFSDDDESFEPHHKSNRKRRTDNSNSKEDSARQHVPYYASRTCSPDSSYTKFDKRTRENKFKFPTTIRKTLTNKSKQPDASASPTPSTESYHDESHCGMASPQKNDDNCIKRQRMTGGCRCSSGGHCCTASPAGRKQINTAIHPVAARSFPPPKFDQDAAAADEPCFDMNSFKQFAQNANFSEIDQAGLVRAMHKRFLVKSASWESLAFMYSRLSFAMHFIVLLVQVFHILAQHFTEIYRLDPNKVQTMQYLCAALTALIAGLQMKLKLQEKCEKYRRGAKTYARLKRATTYCLILIENGGEIEDVSTLWKEAMTKEAKSIPIANMFMST